MKTTTSPKLQYLLDASIEVLHFESTEWLSEIDFWKDETDFFDKLLQKNVNKIISESDTKQLEHLQNRLIYYKGEVLHELTHKIKEQEKQLSAFLNTGRGDEQTLREKHKLIAQEIESFATQYKDYKKELFAFAERIT